MRPSVFFFFLQVGKQLRVDARILRCRKSNFENGIPPPFLPYHRLLYFCGPCHSLPTMGFLPRGLFTLLICLFRQTLTGPHETLRKRHEHAFSYSGVTTICGPLLKVPGNDAPHTAAQITPLPCFKFSAILSWGGHSKSPFAPHPQRVTIE